MQGTQTPATQVILRLPHSTLPFSRHHGAPPPPASAVNRALPRAAMIEPSVRLCRAIRLNDLVLVQRIVRANPAVIRNPDPTDNNHTSLHLAAILGYVDIVVS